MCGKSVPSSLAVLTHSSHTAPRNVIETELAIRGMIENSLWRTRHVQLKRKTVNCIEVSIFFFFFVTDTYKNFSELISVSDNTLVFYAENFDGVKTTKVTHASVHAVAYSVQLSHVHILNIFFIKNRGAYPAYIILSTLQQTRVQAGEFRLYVT